MTKLSTSDLEILKQYGVPVIHLPATPQMPNAYFDKLEEGRGEMKYIQAELANGQIVVWSEPASGMKGHKEAVWLCGHMTGLTVKCLGGGHAEIDHDAKTFRLFSESTNYGAEKDRELSAKLIREAYPDWTVSILN